LHGQQSFLDPIYQRYRMIWTSGKMLTSLEVEATTAVDAAFLAGDGASGSMLSE
jgi:hypothetical protein